MPPHEIQESIRNDVNFLLDFKRDIQLWANHDPRDDPRVTAELRSQINRKKQKAENIVTDAGCMQVVTLTPPPIVGGFAVRNANPFNFIINDYHGMYLTTAVVDLIDAALGVLESPEYLEHRVNLSQQPAPELEALAKGMQRVLQLCKRFHPVARQLQQRHDNRQTLMIKDEYDVQDLFRALLRIDFEDVRSEEWTPSYAGKAGRADFLLKKENIVVEIKKTRESLRAKEVGEQLIIDIARYKGHPNCKCLVCFVYDPDGLIGNPAELERDLSKNQDDMDVRVVVHPNHA